MVKYNRLVDEIAKVIDVIIAIITAAVIIITICAVFMRYVVNDPLAWSEEICLAGFAWFTFLGAGSAIRKRSVVSLDFFYELMPLKVKKIVKIITTVLCTIAYIFIVYYGFKILSTVKMTVTTALQISFATIYIAIPVGGIYSIMALIANLFDVLMDTDKDVSEFSEEAQMRETTEDDALAGCDI